MEQHNCIGQTFYQEQKIVMDVGHAPKEFTEHAFCHEVVHYILYMMGEHDLRRNEKFVDLFAHFMYQFVSQVVPPDDLMFHIRACLEKLRDEAPTTGTENLASNLLEEMEENGY